jgi:hypothetical protein
VYLFPGVFDSTGFLTVESEKILGWGQVIETDDAANGAVMFYGAYKPGKMEGLASADTFDFIRLFGSNLRYRTWQVRPTGAPNLVP